MSLVMRKMNERFKKLTKKQQMLFWGGAMAIFIVLWCNGLFFFAKSKTIPKQEIHESELTVQDAYSALFRSIRADKICFDKARNGYFVRFPDEDDLKNWVGWWFIESPTFYRIEANNSLFTTEIPEKAYTRVFPNVDGMPCATNTEYENK